MFFQLSKKKILNRHGRKNDEGEESYDFLGHGDADFPENFLGKRVVVIFGTGNRKAPQALGNRRQKTGRTELASAEFDERSPNELVADDGNAEEKMKRNFVGPPGCRQKKQPTPKEANSKMRPANKFVQKSTHVSILSTF